MYICKGKKKMLFEYMLYLSFVFIFDLNVDCCDIDYLYLI